MWLIGVLPNEISTAVRVEISRVVQARLQDHQVFVVHEVDEPVFVGDAP